MPLAKFPNYGRTSIRRLLPVTNNSAPADNKPGIDKNRLFEFRLPFVTTVLQRETSEYVFLSLF